mmetsp:Transcript_21184/g.57902  ORF Transcript_21184/g.57902 Transcript_21184/m.57902 type:complete len:217 (-) Transcript_21184:327-977(-)
MTKRSGHPWTRSPRRSSARLGRTWHRLRRSRPPPPASALTLRARRPPLCPPWNCRASWCLGRCRPCSRLGQSASTPCPMAPWAPGRPCCPFWAAACSRPAKPAREVASPPRLGPRSADFRGRPTPRGKRCGRRGRWGPLSSSCPARVCEVNGRAEGAAAAVPGATPPRSGRARPPSARCRKTGRGSATACAEAAQHAPSRPRQGQHGQRCGSRRVP